ncbi:hypothetical protein SJAV_07970 [Sulfurisphaera javensis]|uniref:Uncharacterized protein n=1 Tax=Sulfurisphaera javensis TaxID=2049879 RepID=A0AAT9GPL7_9CREN
MKFVAKIVDNKLEIKNASKEPVFVTAVYVKFRVYVKSEELIGVEAIRNLTEEYDINRIITDNFYIPIPYKDVAEVQIKYRKNNEIELEKIEL